MNFEIDPKELDLQGPDGMQLIKLIRRLAAEVDDEGGGGDTPTPSGENGIFYCQYGTTTGTEISQAVSQGLLPVVKYGSNYYYLYYSLGVISRFFYVDPTAKRLNRVNCSSTQWSSDTVLVQELLDFDYTPTQGSANPVTSGGVYTALQNVGGGGEPYQQYPEMDGVASPGSSDKYARGNHVHPTDTSRAAASEITRIDAALAGKADQASIQQTIEDTVDDWLTAQAPSIGTLSYAAKQALLACFRKVAWIDNQGPAYYHALENELFPGVTVESITAVFTQGSAVIYDTDSLDTLRQYLVVTATYSDSTTETVTDYTLSGALAEGTSTITVSYSGKTATFNVTVTAEPYWTWEYDPAEDGLLSTQSYVQMGTHAGETEEITNGLLHLVVPQNNTQQNSFQARLSDGAGNFNISTGEIVCKVKFSAVSVASTKGSGFRIQMSQGGTRSAKFYISKVDNSYIMRLLSGSNNTTDILNISLETWYIINIKVYENSFVITVNDSVVYNGSNWSTVTSTYCGLYAVSDKLSDGENTNLYIEYMKFRSGGVS